MPAKFIIILLLIFLGAVNVPAQQAILNDDVTGKPEPLLKTLNADNPQADILKREAERSLARARNAIKNSGFYCAVIEFNLWTNMSQRAGTFNEEIYTELKNELYGNSMTHMDKWFTYYVKKGYYNDAQKCLQTWRLHAIAVDKFDEGLYAIKAADLEAIKEK